MSCETSCFLRFLSRNGRGGTSRVEVPGVEAPPPSCPSAPAGSRPRSPLLCSGPSASRRDRARRRLLGSISGLSARSRVSGTHRRAGGSRTSGFSLPVAGTGAFRPVFLRLRRVDTAAPTPARGSPFPSPPLEAGREPCAEALLDLPFFPSISGLPVGGFSRAGGGKKNPTSRQQAPFRNN